jgi:hypothetical protein
MEISLEQRKAIQFNGYEINNSYRGARLAASAAVRPMEKQAESILFA